ncbi:MAG: succinylglutamate desuccinylase/aspartoacylase family protein, partial [Planctomycetales bacterium]|nr:succinylglutamate desuccinylase/aspartoacylase family protein [Planctomycetales bacterium]
IAPVDLRGSVTLVPVVNEPAFARGTRTADDGLDLARTCPGDPTGSITQQIAHEVSALIRAADYYVDLHTGGTRLSLLPLVGYMLHPDPHVLDAQRLMARAFGLNVVWGTDHRLDGRTLSVARDANVPAIYAEWHGAARCEPEGVEAYVTGCLNVMSELDMIDRLHVYRDPDWTVEDARTGAGHLQRCHPAPLAGLFEAAVKLGDHVEAGDPLGTISDTLGDRVEHVTSEQTGIVLCLHTFGRVDEGDSLAVILETHLSQT